MQGRYMKGRLPEGVDFAAYPGRSSTPLPTAESKSAERINQLKIWNEAATNDDKRRLHTAKSKQGLASSGSSNRRTDSFKDARERHSASFQGDRKAAGGDDRDKYADPSDSESEESVENQEPTSPTDTTNHSATQSPRAEPPVEKASFEPSKKVEDVVAADPTPMSTAVPKIDPVESVAPSTPTSILSPNPPRTGPVASAAKPRLESAPTPPTPQPKQSKGCCVIQ